MQKEALEGRKKEKKGSWSSAKRKYQPRDQETLFLRKDSSPLKMKPLTLKIEYSMSVFYFQLYLIHCAVLSAMDPLIFLMILSDDLVSE